MWALFAAMSAADNVIRSLFFVAIRVYAEAICLISGEAVEGKLI